MAPYRSVLGQCFLLIVTLTASIHRNAMAFVPPSSHHHSTRPKITAMTKLSLFIEAAQAQDHNTDLMNRNTASVVNVNHHHHHHDVKIDSIHTSLSSSLVSSVSAAAPSSSSQFKFLGIPLGGAPDPYLNGQSIPPRFDIDNSNTAPTPTSSTEQATTSTPSKTIVDIVDAMPGFKTIKNERPAASTSIIDNDYNNNNNNNIDKIVLTKNDLQYMARAADVASRLPMAMIAYVLLDFFFFNADNDVYKEEIEDDAPGVLVESMFTLGTRIVVILMFVVATTVSSYMFYHPNI